MNKITATVILGITGGGLLGAMLDPAADGRNAKHSGPALSTTLPIEPKPNLPKQAAPSSFDAIKARAVRKAARDFALSVDVQQATVRQLRSQASELELRLFSREFDEAEELFAEAQCLADESLAKADSVLAGNGRISDAWLVQLQNRLSRWHTKVEHLAARLP